jgi:hypothetical protein
MKSVTLLAAAFVAILEPSMTGTAMAADAGDNVKIEIERWRKPGSNNIGTADINITNDNTFAVKDIRVECHYAGKDGGRMINTEQTLAVTVKAKSSEKFKKLKFGYIDTSEAQGSCKVTTAKQI